MKRGIRKVCLILAILILTVFISACGGDSSTPSGQTGTNSSNANSSKQDSTEKGSRDNTPEVLVPSADGSSTETCDVATIDYSNDTEGYVMVSYSGSNDKVKLQITGPDQTTYTYNLSGDYEVFPLTAGDGGYNITVFEHVSDDRYSTALSADITVDGMSEFGPYLYPNQYVNFSADSKAVSKAKDLAYSCDSDIEVIEAVYDYIIDSMSYDYDKASSVQSGYLPDVDQVFASNTGICLDYAAMMATMLRTQRIPTRMEVGYKGDEYHAWISTYVEGTGWINGVIEFDGKDWKLMDPTFADTSSSPYDFIAEDDTYLTKYVY